MKDLINKAIMEAVTGKCVLIYTSRHELVEEKLHECADAFLGQRFGNAPGNTDVLFVGPYAGSVRTVCDVRELKRYQGLARVMVLLDSKPMLEPRATYRMREVTEMGFELL